MKTHLQLVPRDTGELNRIRTSELPASRAVPKGPTCLVACGGIPSAALEANVIGDCLEHLRTLHQLLPDHRTLTPASRLSRDSAEGLLWLRRKLGTALMWGIDESLTHDAEREAVCRRACEPFTREALDRGLVRALMGVAFQARRVLQGWSGEGVGDQFGDLARSIEAFFLERLGTRPNSEKQASSAKAHR